MVDPKEGRTNGRDQVRPSVASEAASRKCFNLHHHFEKIMHILPRHLGTYYIN